jgi:ubiquinol-cytochrome c reductase cytochrome b subunit
LLGVIAMFSAILILLVMPFTDLSRSRGIQFKPLSKAAFFIFVGNFLILMELGAKHVESPFIEFGQISTVIYFAHFLIIVPLISLFENSLIELASTGKSIIANTIDNTKFKATTLSGSLFCISGSKFKIKGRWYGLVNRINLGLLIFILLSVSLFVTGLTLLHLSVNTEFLTVSLLHCDAPRP